MLRDLMKEELIYSIYKNKGSKDDLNNDRGIFIVNIIHGILDKLIYEDESFADDASFADTQGKRPLLNQLSQSLQKADEVALNPLVLRLRSRFIKSNVV